MRIAHFPLITAGDPDSVQQSLRDLSLIGEDERVVSVVRAGEGNMNCVLRARLSDAQSLILKQSRPWVEKYPHIEAPVDRLLAELRFMRTVESHEAVSSHMPRLLGSLPEQYLLVFEDLGEVRNFADQYASNGWKTFPLEALTSWLAHVHAVEIPDSAVDEFANLTLRGLNRAHVFDIPFCDPPAVDLDAVCPGLREATVGIRTSPAMRDAVERWGDLYLESGHCLLHGDFHPGSWLRAAEGVRIIDAEFCFVGRPEFDLAVLAAHCILAGADQRIVERVVALYSTASAACFLKLPLIRGWTSIEILRRILGVAQLPLDNSPSTLQRKLGIAAQLALAAGVGVEGQIDARCLFRS